MKNLIITSIFAMLATLGFAQRFTDKLDRGLVAVPSGAGNLVSWRIMGEEYYDVTYNLYCNGSKIAENLKVSNYTHAAGNASSSYQVAAVVRGVEQAKSKSVTRWENGYFDIPMAPVLDRNGNDVTSQYMLNDVSLGDVDGDGVVEFMVKRNYTGDILSASNTTKFHHYECYKLNGTRLWWIDLGPNLMAGADEQWDLVSFDWDMDGKAECLMRGADNMIIHAGDGSVIKVGDMSYVSPRDEYTRNGAEYLLYMKGETAVPYDYSAKATTYTPMTYPLPRFESGESDYATVWGKNDTGHRSSKHYFGAPYLDGRKPSIFLGRGCYTQHKMCALDVDPVTHQLTQRWRWNASNGSSPWFGNGYHNFTIGDVDWDGRDEIIFGSMMIDDNGKGLCTTGLGHGDAQHCADLDPYRKYSEQFTCNESQPACTYYNATTGEIYYRLKSTSDDGRALCGNFSNDYVGSIGRSTQTGIVSTVKDAVVADGPGGTNDALFWSHLNQRIYWDGDLCDEVYDSPGSSNDGRAAAIYKYPSGRLFNSDGCLTINGTKNNACAIADIFGDWREEVVMRTADNTKIRIFTTSYATTYGIPTLWSDHQYRNAMVTQPIGYNQPPHKSYFLGELEGITQAPPTNTMTGRTEVKNGGTITTTDEHLIVCEMNDTKVSIQDGAKPYMVTFNVPSHVQGNAGSNTSSKPAPTYQYSTCEVTGGGLAGEARLVKQGDGILTLPNAVMKHTGNTDIWAGTVNFDGTLESSPLWLNRFAELNSKDGKFLGGIKADYASIIRPGGKNELGNITTTTYTMGFGSRLVLDLYADGLKADQVIANKLTIETKISEKVWMDYGPQYLQPVLEVVEHCKDGAKTLEPGDYIIGQVSEVVGNLNDIKIEGVTDHRVTLSVNDKKQLVLNITAVRTASEIVWTGAKSSTWDFAKTENFYVADDASKTADIFVKGDVVNFTDDASQTNIAITEDLDPKTFKVNASKNYTFSGNGAITSGALVKEGTGTLTLSTDNSYTGGNALKGGTVVVSSLANENKATGNLGGVTTTADKFTLENGATLKTAANVTNGSPIKFVGAQGGVIHTDANKDFIQNKAFSGTLLTKKGAGWLKTNASGVNIDRAIIVAGAIDNFSGNAAKVVEFQGGTLIDEVGTSNELTIEKDKKGTWNTANRASYTNKITGEGTLDIYCAGEQGSGWVATRTNLSLNLSSFKGTIVPHATIAADGRFTLDTSNGSENCTFNIPENVYVQNSGKTFRIGKLTGKGSLGGFCSFRNGVSEQTNTWQVGNDNNFKFEGVFTSNDNFTKLGSGEMIVTGAWTSTGAVNVSAGGIRLGTGGSLGTGSLTIAKDASLTGVSDTKVALANSSITINGTVQPGESVTATSGNINFGGKNVTVSKTGTITIGIRKSATDYSINNSYLKNIGTLKLAAGTTISAVITQKNIEKFTTDEAVADSFYVWTDVKKVNIAGELNFDLAELLPYNYWDTSRISEGILYVRCDAAKYEEYKTGIEAIPAAEIVNVEVINTNGFTVTTFTCPMGNVSTTFAKTTLTKGIYLLRIQSMIGKKASLKMMK